jgi:hypothetical protein
VSVIPNHFRSHRPSKQLLERLAAQLA